MVAQLGKFTDNKDWTLHKVEWMLWPINYIWINHLKKKKHKNKLEEHVSCWQVVPCLQPCWGRPAEQWSHLAQRKALGSCAGSPWFISFALLIRPWKADEDTAFKGSACCLHQSHWLSNPNKHSLLCQPLTFPWSLFYDFPTYYYLQNTQKQAV